MHAIADYGHYAQPYLQATNGWALGTDYAEMDKYYTGSYGADLAGIKEGLANYAATSNLDGTKVGSASLRLHLDSGTSVEALLKPAENQKFTNQDVVSIKASCDGGPTPEVALLADGRISVRVDGVSAHLLGKKVVVKMDGQDILTFSALSFVKAEIGSGHEGAEDAMCALYNYYQKTMNYRP